MSTSEIEFQAQAAMRHLRERDTIIAGLIERIGPYSITPERPYFFALLASIISQQISTKAAAAIQNRFLALFPDSNRGEVTPSRLLAISKEDLRTAGLSEQKARYVYDLAEKVEQGIVDLAQIDTLPDEEIIEQLTKVKGIGRWTVEMFLIFSLARPDVLPVDDLGFRTAVHRLYKLEERPKPKVLRQFAQQQGWSPYCTTATWYLWESLNLKEE